VESPGTATDARPSRRVVLVALAVVVALALAASLSGLHNGFAYDDIPIIHENPRVHAMHGLWRAFHEAYWPSFTTAAHDGRPAGLFRPLSIVAFAIQWAAGHGAPIVFHAVSIALYAAVAAAVLWLASMLQRWRAAVLSAAVFAVHPVHVEAVGNVVGQSELLAALFCVLGVAVYVRARRTGTLGARTKLGLAALYAAACLSKEHGVLLLPLIVLAEWLALPERAHPQAAAVPGRLRAVAPTWALLGGVAVAFLALRASVPDVVAGAQNTAILSHFPWAVRFYTFLQVVPHWFRLLFWPERLAADYSPQEILVPLRWTWGMLSGVVVAVGVVLLAWLTARRDRATSFAFAWTMTTLSIASGLFVATGVLLAERTLFLPSVGVAMLVGAATDWALRALAARSPRLALAGVGVPFALLLAAGTWRSATRQPVWRDNETLFANGVVDAPLSYGAHYSYGGLLFLQGKYREGERELRMAIRLFPPDPDPVDFLGSRYMAAGMCEHAIPLFHQALAIDGGRRYTRLRLISCLLATGQPDSALSFAHKSVTAVGPDSLLTRMLFVADSTVAHRKGPAS
jgi:hypothetical protein